MELSGFDLYNLPLLSKTCIQVLWWAIKDSYYFGVYPRLFYRLVLPFLLDYSLPIISSIQKAKRLPSSLPDSPMLHCYMVLLSQPRANKFARL